MAKPFTKVDLTSTAVNVKTTGGSVKAVNASNPNAALSYLQFFNALAANVTVGTTAPFWIMSLGATNTANFMGPFGSDPADGDGIEHATAISVAATTTPSGNGAPGTAIPVSVIYE